MTKEQLIKALQPSSTGGQPQGGPHEERTVEELRERARDLGIEGRFSMTKDQLIGSVAHRRRGKVTTPTPHDPSRTAPPSGPGPRP